MFGVNKSSHIEMANRMTAINSKGDFENGNTHSEGGGERHVKYQWPTYIGRLHPINLTGVILRMWTSFSVIQLERTICMIQLDQDLCCSYDSTT